MGKGEAAFIPCGSFAICVPSHPDGKHCVAVVVPVADIESVNDVSCADVKLIFEPQVAFFKANEKANPWSKLASSFFAYASEVSKQALDEQLVAEAKLNADLSSPTGEKENAVEVEEAPKLTPQEEAPMAA